MAIRIPEHLRDTPQQPVAQEPHMPTNIPATAQQTNPAEKQAPYTPTSVLPGAIVIPAPPRDASNTTLYDHLVDHGVPASQAAAHTLDRLPARRRVLTVSATRALKRYAVACIATLGLWGTADLVSYNAGGPNLHFLSLLNTRFGVDRIRGFFTGYAASDLDNTGMLIQKYGDLSNAVVRVCMQDGKPHVSLEERPGSQKILTDGQTFTLNDPTISRPLEATTPPGTPTDANMKSDRYLGNCPTTTTTTTLSTTVATPTTLGQR